LLAGEDVPDRRGATSSAGEEEDPTCQVLTMRVYQQALDVQSPPSFDRS
jgi:hypothetical protein